MPPPQGWFRLRL